MSLKKYKEDCNSQTAEHLFIINSLAMRIVSWVKIAHILWQHSRLELVYRKVECFIDIGCALEI